MKDFLVPYDDNWKTEFEALRNVLLDRLITYSIDIQHVGSTAVEGIYAKPILDIDIIIENKNLLDGISKKLTESGYINRGDQGIPGRYAFRQSTPFTPETRLKRKWQEHHLYVCYADSVAVKNHLLFRDALKNSQQLAEQYSDLKLKLASERGMTREIYNHRKTDFILEVLSSLGFNETELSDIKKANT
jgi:GrpB-like predicted nucleotidyltransferase (UPF0157 family)